MSPIAGPAPDAMSAPGATPAPSAMPGQNKTTAPWPPLREELRLSHGPCSEFGAPTWTLHDPAAHKFYRIGWLEFEVLSRWSLASAEAILESIRRETTLSPALESVQAVYDFALRNCLVLPRTAGDTARLIQQKDMGKTSLAHKVMHGYLFLRIPLFSPDAWLEKTLPRVRWMFSREFCAALLLSALLGLYLISREWVSFLLHIGQLWSWQQSLFILFSLGVAKCVHELGHAFAAKKLGLKVPRMGIALMCFMPVLWTDVTESWKLPKRTDRLLVDMSGVGAELLLATAASLLWPLLPPGELKSAMLTLAGTTWLATLAVNANPFMRYDGYYILSDIWDIPGLQQRAFALARWRLREEVFGFGDPPPEAMPAAARAKLILYSYGTWLYRFFLFMGIALLVYHLFFKILGFALMMVELVWFIGLPVYKELKHWYSRRGTISLTRQTVRSALLATFLLLLFIFPWRSTVEGTGLLTARQTAFIYTPHAAQMQAMHVQPGETVKAGTLLVTLASPMLDSRIAVSRSKLATLEYRVAAASLDPELRMSYSMDMREMQSTALELAGLLKEKDRLTIRAPIAGTVRDIPGWAVPGVWLPENTLLGLVTGGGGAVTAYVAEEDVERLEAGTAGLFYPSSGFFPAAGVTVLSIEPSATRDIPQLELPTTMHGGILPAQKDRDGRIVPEQALYKIHCRVQTEDIPAQALSGRLSLTGKRQSFAARLWRSALGLAIRESGLE